MTKKVAFLISAGIISLLIAPAIALQDSVGKPGVNALRLHQAPYNLLGRKIGIGQVEVGRPVKLGKDKAANNLKAIMPQAVFYRDQLSSADKNVDEHASMVAQVMIAQDKLLKGVAPQANLYASAVGSLNEGGQPQECLTSQHIAQQNNGDIRAINFSFGESLARDERNDAQLDGRSLLTSCIDWSAKKHNVLYVVAGNQGKGGIPIPTDNFNGVTTPGCQGADHRCQPPCTQLLRAPWMGGGRATGGEVQRARHRKLQDAENSVARGQSRFVLRLRGTLRVLQYSVQIVHQ